MRRALLALLLVGAVSCGAPEPDRVPGPSLLDGHAPEIVAEVSVTTGGFDPDQLTLDTSEAFEVVNDADEGLRVDGEVGADLRYDTGMLLPGESSVIAFDAPGRYTFTIRDGDASGLEVTVTPG